VEEPDSHRTLLENLAQAANLIRDVAGDLGQLQDVLDLTSSSVQIPASSVDIGVLERLMAHGGRFSLRLSIDVWSLVIDGPERGVISINADQRVEAAFGGDAVDAARDAIRLNRSEDLLAMCGDAEVDLRMSVENRSQESGFHWIRTKEALVAALSAGVSSVALLGRIAPGAGAGVALVVVQEGLENALRAGRILFGSPTTVLDEAVYSPPDEAVAAGYAQRYLVRAPFELPVPSEVFKSGEHAGDLARLLNGLCVTTAWCWLASNFDMAGHVTFEGARVLDVDVQGLGPEGVHETLELWQWAVASLDADRREALHRAITFGFHDAADLRHPQQILRNAKWLLDLARRGAVAEALSTRRAVRDAAFGACRAAVDGCSSAAGKAFDRTLVQLGAITGLFVAQSKALLDARTAAQLITLAGALLLVSAVANLLLDYGAATTPLRNFLADLDLYRDALSESDVKEIRDMKSVQRTASFVSQRRLASAAIHGGALVVSALLVWRLVGSHPGDLLP